MVDDLISHERLKLNYLIEAEAIKAHKIQKQQSTKMDDCPKKETSFLENLQK